MTDLSRILNAPFRTAGFRRPVTVRQSRDAQRSRMYAAENSLPETHPTPRDFATLAEVAEYANRIVASATWKKLVGTTPRLKIVPKRVHSGAHCQRTHTIGGATVGATLAFSTTAFSKMIVLHELAHVPHVPTGEGWHGRAFARLYLALVRRFLGRDVHDRLKAAFKLKGVKYVKTGSRRGNPAALAAWKATQAAAKEGNS